jgi:hypothetical protein
MEHRYTRGVCGRHEFRRISPKKRQGRDLFVDADLNARTMREVENEVHAKRLVG